MESYLPKLTDSGRRWARFIALLIAIVLFCWIVYGLRTVFTPLLAALAIAYVLNPLVTWCESWGVRRLVVVTVVFVLLGALVIGGGLYAVAQLISQLYLFEQRLPVYLERFGRWIESLDKVTDWGISLASLLPEGLLPATRPVDTLPAGAPGTQPAAWWTAVAPILRAHGVQAASSAVNWLLGLTASLVGIATLLVLLPMYTFVFLWRFNDIVTAARDHLPAAYREVIVHVAKTIDGSIANFFRGRLLVCLLVGTLTGIGLSIIGVPYSVALGITTGVLNLVPFGSSVAVPLTLLAAWSGAVDRGVPWAWPVGLAMAVYLIVQAVESFVLSPYIEGQSSGLHPITIVVALLIGAQLAGMLGMLLAIPLASTLKALAVEWLLPEIRRLAQPPPAP